ncbi:uncharacterized protein LOC103715735 isoform X1 [Phoenix dactylifera]|uniref:Uncharacterized protein LOC103715735 isoform X1 n=1 Tax=Phoenix dactylifera TaxID=42345 RepID=A0A8B7CLE3_PHODC|nr:uncharacterized protein LOC103715735 isoform X1 [Phoenix dactylifera]
MAFHVACPITCRRICYCELGFPAELRSEKARVEFLEEVEALEEFLRDPWTVRADGGSAVATVQVLVPQVVPQPAPPPGAEDGGGGGRGEAKRAAMQRQAVAASLAAEDYVRRLEGGGAAEAPGEVASHLAIEDQNFSTVKVMCRICFSGENDSSVGAMKMLSCKICSKKYHRSCLKRWAEHRDLFHWSSWACPSCRICEVCRRTGDPNKLMFCKRCDGAYHCYCQQPPHKNVSHGPYLCPKHTRCHSCGSTVPGSGLSTRWFLGYTCCDACGRLFVKGNYCPVCLKVYRDSEMIPMVCCDVCERWVHCVCDGISDEKYQQFQADQNLYYKCAACRGNCYQVKDIDDAVRELWRRRDIVDCDQIASLRAAAGLPSQEEILSLSPYSYDENAGPVILKDDSGRTLKFSVKGISDKPLKNFKEHGKSISKNSTLNKKYVKKKGYQLNFVGKPEETYQNIERQHEARSFDRTFRDQKIDDMNSLRTNGPEIISSSMTRSTVDNGMKFCDNQMGTHNNSFTNEVAVHDADTEPKVKIKGGKLQSLHFKECGIKNVSKSESVRGTKLVIHIGSRNRNVSGSPRSETSSCHRDQDLASFNGGEDTSLQRTKDNENHMLDDHGGTVRSDGGKGAKLDNLCFTRSSKHGFKEKNVIKLRKVYERQGKNNSGIGEACELTTASRSPLVVGKRNTEEGPAAETLALTNDVVLQKKQPADTPVNSFTHPKPLLKLKFKNPSFEQRSSWAPQGEEVNSVKGQRSKRKRSSAEKVSVEDDENYRQLHRENPMDEAMDANWILQKLGKDAIGKRVEVHQSSDNSWHQGVVSDINRGTSSLSICFDDGRSKTLLLGRQGIRLISQKQKKTKT